MSFKLRGKPLGGITGSLLNSLITGTDSFESVMKRLSEREPLSLSRRIVKGRKLDIISIRNGEAVLEIAW